MINKGTDEFSLTYVGGVVGDSSYSPTVEIGEIYIVVASRVNTTFKVSVTNAEILAQTTSVPSGNGSPAMTIFKPTESIVTIKSTGGNTYNFQVYKLYA